MAKKERATYVSLCFVTLCIFLNLSFIYGQGGEPWTETDFGMVRQPPGPVNLTKNVKLPVETHSWFVNLYFNGDDWCDPDYPQMVNIIMDPFCMHLTKQGRHEPLFTNMELQYVYNYGNGNPHVRIPHELSDALVVFPYSGAFAGGPKMDAYSDWSVKISWDDGKLEAFCTAGLPFVQFHSNDGGITIKTDDSTRIWYEEGNAIGVHVFTNHFDNGTQTWFRPGSNNYIIYGPTGCTWVKTEDMPGRYTFKSTLEGKNYAAIATIPNFKDDERKVKALKYMKDFAFNFITDTKISWEYDEGNAKVITTLTAKYDKKEETSKDALLCGLYPHQWQLYRGEYADFDSTFNTSRGPMKLIEADKGIIEIVYPYYGILPHFPLAASEETTGFSSEELTKKIRSDIKKLKMTRQEGEIYSASVICGRTAQLIRIADQNGNIVERDNLIAQTKATVENWLTYSKSGDNVWLVYDKNYGALIGNPPNQGMFTDLHLNDTHFQFGYLLKAASIVAHYDKAWMNTWKGRVENMIKYVSNWKRDDPQFPFLRFLDPYRGFSWATGDADFRDGNNQESSSESLNYASAVALWGMQTGNKEIRDLGIYLYTVESDAVLNYWWDIHDVTYANGKDYGDKMEAMWNCWGDAEPPAQYHYPMSGFIFGGKYDFATWFGSEQTGYQEYPVGINLLPMTGASVYLSRNPTYVKDKLVGWFIKKYGKVNRWNELFWEYLALADPDKAMEYYNTQPHGASEPSPPSETEGHYYHWMHNLKKMGPYNPNVRANRPSFAVFGNEKKTYVAFNPTAKEMKFVFTDGAYFNVPAGQLVAVTDPNVSVFNQNHWKKSLESLALVKCGNSYILHTNFPEKSNVSIYNLKGKKMTTFSIEKGIMTNAISRGTLSSGVYLIKITNRMMKQNLTKKVTLY